MAGDVLRVEARVRRRLGAVALLLATGAAVTAGVYIWRTRGLSSVQRGHDLAVTHGCFGCHGPGGARGFDDTSEAALGDVPTFTREALEGYAKDESEIREWILDGRPRRLREEAARETPPQPAPLFVMPAFRDVLSTRDADDLVAYVVATSGFHAPVSGPIAAGLETGERLGCFTCHGPQGRGALPNPRSLKGYIPPWDSPDLAELARNEDELREWILDGSPRRLRDNALARFFLQRQALQMPAYRGRIADADVERLVAYIRALPAE